MHLKIYRCLDVKIAAYTASENIFRGTIWQGVADKEYKTSL